jgi:pimeloyl-ACP methyl ester carboxylesterase
MRMGLLLETSSATNSAPAVVMSATSRPARDTTMPAYPAPARMRTSSTAAASEAPPSSVGTTTSTAVGARGATGLSDLPKCLSNDCSLKMPRGEFKGIDGADGLGNGCLLHHGYLADKKGRSSPASIESTMSEARLVSLVVESSPKRTIAVRTREGRSPGLVWLGGFKSDMKGTKAEALDRWAASEGRACVRFDYSGHGESGGAFTDGTISRWLEESVAVYLQFAHGAQVLIGSSMGGWLALLLAKAVSERPGAAPIAGMVLIAPAVDFTEELMWKQFPDATRQQIERTGTWMRPSAYGEEPYPITRALIEDGRRHLLLGGLIETRCPVHILQGVEDPDVPWRHAIELVSRFSRDDVVLTLIKDGDHRLSRPEDIERLIGAVKEF